MPNFIYFVFNPAPQRESLFCLIFDTLSSERQRATAERLTN